MRVVPIPPLLSVFVLYREVDKRVFPLRPLAGITPEAESVFMAAELEKGGVFFFAVDLQQERGDSSYLFVHALGCCGAGGCPPRIECYLR